MACRVGVICAKKRGLKVEIIKIQVPIFTNSENPQALLYNKDQSIMTEMDAWLFEEIMDGSLKKYFECSVNDAGILTVIREVKPQNW